MAPSPSPSPSSSPFLSPSPSPSPSPSTIHREPSFRWFDPEQVGPHHDIESGGDHLMRDTSRPSIFMIESSFEGEGPHTPITRITKHHSVTQPSVEAIIAIITLGSTIMVGLLSLNFPTNRDDDAHHHIPTALFYRHPMSLCFFVVIAVTVFYFTAIGAILCRFRPSIARTLNLIALILAVLAVTVLLWALLPKKFSWVPWIFFAMTVLAALVVQAYEWAMKESTDNIQCLDCDRIGCPKIRTPSFIARNSSQQLLFRSWMSSPRLRRVQSSAL